jgi:hypothetical protein
MKIKKFLLLTELIICANFVFANEPFFFRGVRPAGIGGAFVAVADDANAIFYNPAGMGLIQGKGIEVETIYQDFSWVWKSFDPSVEHNFSELGISLRYTAPSIGIAYSWFRRGDRKDEIPICDYYDNILGKFKYLYNEDLVTIAYGKEIGDNIYMGMAGTYAHFDFDGDLVKFFKSNENLSLDIGFLYKPLQETTLGLTIQNILSTKSTYPITTDISFACFNEKKRLPINLNLGLSYKWNKILVSADLTNLFSKTIELV